MPFRKKQELCLVGVCTTFQRKVNHKKNGKVVETLENLEEKILPPYENFSLSAIVESGNDVKLQNVSTLIKDTSISMDVVEEKQDAE